MCVRECICMHVGGTVTGACMPYGMQFKYFCEFLNSTVEPLIVDPPKYIASDCIINFSTKDTVRGPKNYMPYTFSTSKRGIPLYTGQNS